MFTCGPALLAGSGAVGVTDTYFSSVTLLLHADGDNGSTGFTDSSSSPKTMTVNGDAQVSTATPKFGTGALSVGSTGYLSTPSAAPTNFGSGDFTIECQVRPATLTSGVLLATGDGSSSATTGFYFYITATGRCSFYCYSGSSAYSVTLDAVMVAGSYKHVAVTRLGGVLTLWIDGVSVSVNSTLGAAAINSVAANLTIGRAAATQFNGNIDEIRITRGVARYTATFTPPIAAFPNS